MANKFRGEIEFTLCGKTYKARPTFEALVEFEDKSGTTAYEALRSAAERQAVSFKVVAAALYSGIRAAWDSNDGRPPSFSEIGTAVQRDGLGKVLPFYVLYLTNALSSDEDLQRKVDEPGKAEAGETPRT